MISESPATPRYPKYRSAGIEWLEEIPSHWDVSPLFLVSKENDARNHQQVESNVLSLSYGRIVRRDVSLHHGLLPESFETYQVLQPGDIVLRLTDLQNDKRSLRVGLVPEPGIITSAYVGLSLRDSLESRFAYYLLHSYDVTKVFYRLGGGVRQTMKFADLRRLPIVLPPAQEQHAIADFLDRETAKIDGLVARKERLIELLQEKRTALITRAVTRGLDPNVPMKDSGVEWLGEIPAHWEVKRIKNLSTFVTSGSRGWAEFYSNEGSVFLRVGNVQPGSIDLNMDEVQHVDPPPGSEGERTRVRPSDVLVSITALIGAVAVVPEALPEAFVNQHLALIRLSTSGVDSRWIAYCIMSPVGQTQFAARLYGGTKDGLGLSDVRSLVVLTPPVREQERIVAYLDNHTTKLMKLVQAIRTASGHLKELRTALISAAVTGKIDVRGQAA